MKRRLAMDGRSLPSDPAFTASDRRRLFWLRLAFAAFWIAVATGMVLAAR